MNRPSIGVRFAGSRLGAFLLLMLCAWGVVAWYRGDASEWVMMAALMAGLWTLKCVAVMRRYMAWAAEWNAMGGNAVGGSSLGNPPIAPARSVKKRHVLRWCWLLGLLALAVMVIGLPHASGAGREALLQLGAADYVFLPVLALVTVGRLLLRRGRVKAVKADAKAKAAPVAWMMGRASSSPSRADAARNVPGYCAGLLGG